MTIEELAYICTLFFRYLKMDIHFAVESRTDSTFHVFNKYSVVPSTLREDKCENIQSDGESLTFSRTGFI